MCRDVCLCSSVYMCMYLCLCLFCVTHTRVVCPVLLPSHCLMLNGDSTTPPPPKCLPPPIPEGDAYFTNKLQDYTAVEKDQVVLECELNKDVNVVWYFNELEIKPSKMLTIKAEDKRRSLVIKRVTSKNKGQYVCDCGTDKTTASLDIEGKEEGFFLFVLFFAFCLKLLSFPRFFTPYLGVSTSFAHHVTFMNQHH